jgi:hypothetical protein
VAGESNANANVAPRGRCDASVAPPRLCLAAIDPIAARDADGGYPVARDGMYGARYGTLE